MHTYYNLTQPQIGIWETDQFYKGTPISNIGGTLLIDEDIDFQILKKAIRKFVEKNDAMRTRIKVVEGTPFQYIIPYEYFPIKLHDFTGSTKEEEEEWLLKKTQVPFSATNEALFRFDMIKSHDGRCGYLVVIHHIICDGWTNALKFGQTMEYYAKLAGGGKIDHTTNPSYIDYINKEKNYLNSEKHERDRDFWMDRYKEKPVQASIKLKDKENHNHKANRMDFVIEGELSSKIHEFCREHSVSPAVLMEGILGGVYANRFHDINEMTIGIPVLNRRGIKEKSTVGMFVNTLPVQIKVDDHSNFVALCKQITMEHMQLFRHRSYPMNELLSDMRKKHKITHNFYDICVSYSNGKINKPNHDYQFSTKWHFSGTQSDSLCLHIDDRDDNGTFVLLYDYLVAMFSEKEIMELHKRLTFLLDQCISNVGLNVCDLELIDDCDRQLLQFEFNDTLVDYPNNKTYFQCFEEQVEKTPHDVAIIFKNRKLTYEELNNRSNILAHQLIKQGVTKNNVVGLMFNRSENVFVAQLGIMKSGACYLPIDPNYPKDRIDYMLEDSGADILVTSSLSDYNSTMSHNIKKIYIEDIGTDHTNNDNPNVDLDVEDSAYLIYTSGSTGKPKGSLIAHKGLVNFCNESHISIYGGCIPKSHKRIISLSTISFDMFVIESLVPLYNGMTVVMADEDEQNNQTLINNLVIEHNIETLVATPTRMKLLLLDDDGLNYLSYLKNILIGGEAFSSALYKQLRCITEAKLWNIYGPTEITVMCTQTELTSDQIIIGKPISNTQIFILDRNMKMVPIGITGEIYVSGDGVGLGYLNQPEITSERFIDNPYDTKGKMYKTGDIGSWDVNGNIHHHGRNDFQVKINGLRIELEEIENAMVAIGGAVEEAVVTVLEENSGKQSLCSYYVSSEVIDNEIFHSKLKETLPGYMIPLYYIRLDSLPQMPCGKVDRNKLPEPTIDKIMSREIVSPRNKFENVLSKILLEVLELDVISIDDHIFYELGGDSFAAIQIQFLIEKEGFDIDINDLYQYSSIRELSEFYLKDEEEHHYEDKAYKHVLHKSDYFSEKKKINSVLLTGATGFLGSHLLIRILQTSDAKVTCLVRSKERLDMTLEHYFGFEILSYLDRIEIISGDIEESNFGLSDNKFNSLIDNIDTVYHAAANVRHFGIFEDFYKTNVSGTKEIIRFCKKNNATLHHISTMSVSGDGSIKQNSINPKFSETSLYIGQDYQSNVYIHTKYLAEKEVIDATEHGLNACIYRVGNLMWRESDGNFQKNIHENSFINRIHAFKKLKALPEMLADMHIDITPIDKCAEAIVLLANSANKSEIFHIINHKKVSIKNLLNKSKLKYETIPFKDFLKNVSERRDDDHIGILYLYLNQMIEYYNKMDVDVKSSKTKKKLKSLGFAWKSHTDDYISQCPVSNDDMILA